MNGGAIVAGGDGHLRDAQDWDAHENSSAPRRRSSRGSPELAAGRALLADGKWHHGAALLRAMGKVVPPGEAGRFAVQRLKTNNGGKGVKGRLPSQDELIRIGRNRKAQIRIANMIKEGLWESNPPTLTRPHWVGDLTWQVRDRYPGAIGVPEAADQLGIADHVLGSWIRLGYVPPPERPRPNGERFVTRAQLDAYRKVAAARLPNGRFSVVPTTLWKADLEAAEAAEHICPTCGTALRITVSVAAANPNDHATDGTDDPETPDRDRQATNGE